MGRQRTRGCAIMIEPLQGRQLLSADLVTGELQVIGTHVNDRIRVYVDPRAPDQITVQVNRDISRFALVSILSVNVQAGQGNDVVSIEGKAPKYSLPTRVYGSGGNDTISGGTGVDRIYGGNGDDSINGGAARDIIYGEAGNDLIDGEQGNDFLSGGIGNDSLFGGLGIDYIFGNEGSDFIDSLDDTTDHVDGGTGIDTADSDSILDQTFISIEHFVS